ncbi:MAG TPA: hypothetical protein VND22_05695 [Actinomycetota bacterium]|nr:hypothetical protein [Actinomycetota bacterium]
MMKKVPKVLVLGPAEGPQGEFVKVVSQVKVRSSAGTGEGVVPMHFGRIRFSEGLDLQVYGADRERVEVVVEALRVGLIGGLVLFSAQDLESPEEFRSAVAHLRKSGIPLTAAAIGNSIDKQAATESLGLHGLRVLNLNSLDKETVKAALLTVLEGALASTAQTSA